MLPGSAGKGFVSGNGTTSAVGSLDPSLDLSVIVVSWRTKDLLRTCLTSVRELTGRLRAQTIVVDNASGDGSAKMVVTCFPEVLLLVNERNMGFAAANNRGLRHAHGRYLLLLNSDTVVLPGALDAMARYMDEHAEVGALGPRLLNADRSLQSSARDFPTLSRDVIALLEIERWPLAGVPATRYMRRGSLYWDDHRRTQPVDWVMGACLLLRREAITEVGLLDDGYFFFGEEMDLCYRLRQKGWDVVFFADAEIVHLGGQSAARVPAARLMWHYAGILRFYSLHRDRPRQLVLRLTIALAAINQAARLLIRHRRAPGARPLLAAYARVFVRALTT